MVRAAAAVTVTVGPSLCPKLGASASDLTRNPATVTEVAGPGPGPGPRYRDGPTRDSESLAQSRSESRVTSHWQVRARGGGGRRTHWQPEAGPGRRRGGPHRCGTDSPDATVTSHRDSICKLVL